MRLIIRNSLWALFVGLLLSACRGSKIPSESGNKDLVSDKKELCAKLIEDASKEDINTYYSKNVDCDILWQGTSQSVKANIYFENNKQTVISARATFAFIPVNVGKILISKDACQVKSKILGDSNQKLPLDLNPYLHNALLGRIPQLYEVLGEKDFSNFAMSISSDDKYIISRETTTMTIKMTIDGKSFSLDNFEITFLGSIFTYTNASFSQFDNNYLPNQVHIEGVILGKNKKLCDATLKMSTIEINGTNTIEF